MVKRPLLVCLLVGSLFVVSLPQATYGQETIQLMVELSGSSASLPLSVQHVAVASRRLPVRALHQYHVLEVPADRVSDIENQLSQYPGVISARPEYIYQAAFVPNDPQFSAQYGLQSINAPAAWDRTTGSSSTVIAIVDGGVDLTHEDLSSKAWANPGEIPSNGIDDDHNGYVDDINGWDFVARRPAGIAINHATHVAGIAAAASNNGTGVAGVDWGARIMSVRVLGSSGAGAESAIIDGINYAVANHARIINLSIAGSASPALAAAIENAYSAGVVVVAAAGNSGISTNSFPVYPACADAGGINMVLGVGATDKNGEPTSFSNFGKCVDVSAPGKDIVSTTMSTLFPYGKMSGTSMASPFVAGVAGLYLSIHPEASPAEVINAIITDADPFTGPDAADWNAQYKGKLDAAAVVGVSVQSVPSPTPTPSPSPSPSSSPSFSPSPTPIAEPASSSSSGGDSGGGGGGGDSQPAPAPKPKPKVLGIRIIKPNLALLLKINLAFRTVFGRNPNIAEHAYWYTRVKHGDKRSFQQLLGAMAWQHAHGRTYVH